MTRETILNEIKQNKPSGEFPVPENIFFAPNFDDNVLKFADTLKSIGGSVVELENYETIKKNITNSGINAGIVVSTIREINIGNLDLEKISDPHDLALVDLAILRGEFGVAENGAIWLSETHIGVHRVLPFITQHLIIILDKKNIVSNMHEAYQRLNIKEIGFGVFLAGPSKTADIEQSLVIGAHGARSLRVYLVG